MSDPTAAESEGGFDALADELVVRVLSHLRWVDLVNVKGTCRRLKNLAGDWQTLAGVTLRTKKSLTDDDLIEFAAVHASLESLDLTGCRGITDAGLAGVAEHCTRLEGINIAKTDHITPAGLEEIAALRTLTRVRLPADDNDAFLAVLALHASDSLTELSAQQLGTEGLTELLPQFTNLETLALKSMRHSIASAAQWAECMQSFSGLRRLTLFLNGNDLINRFGLQHLPEGLVSLSVRGFAPSNTTLAAIGERNTALERLSMVGVYSRPTGHPIDFSPLGGCLRLETLSLANCSGLCDEAIATISHIPSLTSLNVRKTARVTAAGFEELFGASTLDRLASLDLRGCAPSADAIIQLAAGSPHLTYLNLYGCTEVNDDCLIALAAGCPELSKIYFSWCPGFTEVGVEALVANLHNVTYINLFSCDLNEAAAAALLGADWTLESLHVGSCFDLSVETVQALHDRYAEARVRNDQGVGTYGRQPGDPRTKLQVWNTAPHGLEGAHRVGRGNGGDANGGDGGGDGDGGDGDAESSTSGV